MSTKKEVALVLSSGGPRGFAYIGAIEELLERGYTITSVAGTSIGSLIGGIYAAGKLPEFKKWLFSLDKWNLFSLMDLSFGKNHFVRGDRIIEAINQIVPDVNIEDLEIPYKAIATDLYTGEEIIFDKGKLLPAIRASISIPSLFRPVKHDMTSFIDGAMTNCLPLNRIDRKEGDILVAFDVNHIDINDIRENLKKENAIELADAAFEEWKSSQMKEIIDGMGSNSSNQSFMKRLKRAGIKGAALLKEVMAHKESMDLAEQENDTDFGETYYSILDRSFSILYHTVTELSIQLNRPDILVRMPFDSYGEIADYIKGAEISELGRNLMREALDKYENI
ncbi:MAG: phospholipase [Bacteroidales bacterium]|nr:phospholipase [Bacteroidales bacterium]MBP3343156.1 patatin-like phospholipase family protein [Bacteroidales bacterium]